MTEDDTFRALSRVPFTQVKARISHMLETWPPEELPTWQYILASMGWTDAEYEIEANKRRKRNDRR